MDPENFYDYAWEALTTLPEDQKFYIRDVVYCGLL
jgi:hypothetical protein